VSLEFPDVVAGAMICAGSALLPDVDHPSATIAHTYGGITHLLSRIVNAVSGGHRHATHSLLFVLIAGGLTEGVAQLSPVAVQVCCFMLIGFGLRGLGFGVPGKRITSAIVNAVANCGLLGVFALLGVRYEWIGVAVALGCLVHLVGDCITSEGCPLLWPYLGRLSIPFVPRSGGRVERWIVTPLLIIVIAIFAARALSPLYPSDWPHPWRPGRELAARAYTR